MAFQKGQSGNPNGKPKGTRHRVTMAAETLMEGEAEAITRKAIELAKGGDGPALRLLLCMDPIYPPRKDRSVRFRLPSLDKAEDAVAAHASIVAAVPDSLRALLPSFHARDEFRRLDAPGLCPCLSHTAARLLRRAPCAGRA